MGRPYWNVGAVKEGLQKLPGYQERAFDQDLGIDSPYEGPGHTTPLTPLTLLNGIKVLWGIHRQAQQQEKKWDAFRKRQLKRLDQLAQIVPSTMSESEWSRFYRSFVEEAYFISESHYFIQIYNTSNVSTLFKDRLKKLGQVAAFTHLVSGLQGVSHLDLNNAAWNLSRTIRAIPETLQFWQSHTPEE